MNFDLMLLRRLVCRKWFNAASCIVAAGLLSQGVTLTLVQDVKGGIWVDG